MKRSVKLAAVLLFCATTSLFASEVVVSHCYGGACPQEKGTDAQGVFEQNDGSGHSLILRQLFAASVDLQTDEQLPRWLAYRIVSGSVGIASLLPREWRADSLLTQRALPNLAEDASTRFVQPDLSGSQDRDYRMTEVTLLAAEQGRLAPMTSFSGTPLWQELNLLSNRARLPSGLRLGPWSRLDQALNELAQRLPSQADGRPETIYVISGPLPESPTGPIGFFKIARLKGSYAAFAFPATTQSHADYCESLTALESLEARAQINYFPAGGELSNDLAAALGCPSLN